MDCKICQLRQRISWSSRFNHPLHSSILFLQFHSLTKVDANDSRHTKGDAEGKKKNSKNSPQSTRPWGREILAKGWLQRLAKDFEEVSFSSTLTHLFDRSEKGISKICTDVSKGNILISPQAYQEFVDFLISHLYVANPQARIGAIQCLTLSGYQSLNAKGVVSCSDFKTADAYAYQCVTACPASQR